MSSPTEPSTDPAAAKQFAIQVVQRLREAGFQALWAGGCVRDRLLDLPIKDYDVATSATPDQVRDVFGRKRTLAIGAAFGVITVLGSRKAGPIEVATFRRDEGYSDGRHPDHISFADAHQDAQRRDFTINGLFFDPVDEQVLDYVNGRADLGARLVRAIGDPHERFNEDKLRMLRAVRFTTTLGFDIESETAAAIAEHAAEISQVSAERITAEMRRVLTHVRSPSGLELIGATGLQPPLLPEFTAPDGEFRAAAWQIAIAIAKHLPTGRSFSQAVAGLLWPVLGDQRPHSVVQTLARRWHLTNHEQKEVIWLLAHVNPLRHARQNPWPVIQRILADSRVESLVDLAQAIVNATQGPQSESQALDYCREKLRLPAEQLNPAPLVNGQQLQSLGIPPGPTLGKLLHRIRDLQLDGQLSSTAEALKWAETEIDRLPSDAP